MNITSITLYISQITFGIILLFALTSFIIYKLRGKNIDYEAFEQGIELKSDVSSGQQMNNRRTNLNVVSYSVEAPDEIERVVSSTSFSRDSFSVVKSKSQSMKDISRFTVVNSKTELTLEKPTVVNNWS
ncbi:hypothetical protein MASR2M39_14720 [Ignavibacteriales bacterium]